MRAESMTPVKIRAYADNCIVSGRARGDLETSQMAAIEQLKQFEQDGKLEIVTSRESWREQDRTKSEEVRAILEQSRPDVPVVQHDHELLGFTTLTDPYGGFTTNPLLTDIVDQKLFDSFQKTGLTDAPDARHLMYAVHNDCHRFLTTDPHFLTRRAHLEALCRGLTIVTPVELAKELDVERQ